MSPAQPSPRAQPLAAVLLAFAAIYLIWGSTYLAIAIAIETLPGYAMAALRFLAAGGALYAFLRLRGAARPTLLHWRSAAIIGALLLLIGNGTVVWAEGRIPSGLAALLITMTPAWMVLLEWLAPGGARPGLRAWAGLAGGLLGVVLLVAPGTALGAGSIDPWAALAVLAASVGWAVGSLYARRAPLPPSPFLATAMEMLAGGVLLALVALARGEWSLLDPAAVSARSWLALLYLVVAGSIVALSAYVYLLGATTPARVSTYAYVNPIVAVLLGWLIADEPISARTALAAAIIVASVVLLGLPTRQRPREASAATATPAVALARPAVPGGGEG